MVTFSTHAKMKPRLSCLTLRSPGEWHPFPPMKEAHDFPSHSSHGGMKAPFGSLCCGEGVALGQLFRSSGLPQGMIDLLVKETWPNGIRL